MEEERRRYRRDRDWAQREGVWDEDYELTDEPPLPERLKNKVKRASREMGEDVSKEVERMGGRLREWSGDAGRKAERLADDIGSGIERAGRSSRRWIPKDEDERDYERALYDVDEQRMEKRRDEEEEWAREKVLLKEERRKKEKKEQKKQKEREKEKEKARQKLAPDTRKAEGGGWGWSWWGHKRETAREGEEVLPEGRIADVKFKHGEVDVVCVDSSIASEQAFRYALRNIPRGHTLLLVHGIFTPPGAVDSKIEDEKEMFRVKRKFLALCKQHGRRCAFRDFEFTNNADLGEQVCSIAERQHAGSVILGKRAAASELRRALLGSPSLSVMERCDVPVTLIAERKEGSIF
jgi:nucleotide-binding universal stress UspA family protein